MWNCSWSKSTENKQCMLLHPLNPVSYFCGYHSLCCCLISCHVYRIHLVCCPEPPANHRGSGSTGRERLDKCNPWSGGGALIAPNSAVRGQQWQCQWDCAGLELKSPVTVCWAGRPLTRGSVCMADPLRDLILGVAAGFQTDSTAAWLDLDHFFFVVPLASNKAWWMCMRKTRSGL